MVTRPSRSARRRSRARGAGGAVRERAGVARVLRVAALSAALGVALSGCGEEPITQVIVAIGGDIATPGTIDRLRVQVVGPDGRAQAGEVDLGAGALEPPRTLSLVHETGRLGPFDVRVTGYDGGAAVLERRAVFSFVPDETRVLRMDLLASCVCEVCPAQQTCTAQGCASIAATLEARGALTDAGPPAALRVRLVPAVGESAARAPTP